MHRAATFPRPEPPKRIDTSSFASTTWDVTEQILQTVTAAAQFVPTPYLGRVAVVALSIFEAVQGAKDNQVVMKQLTYTVCSLVTTVYDTFLELHPGQAKSETFSDDAVLNKHVEDLLHQLMEINDWITQQSSRHKFRKIISSRSDLNVIQNFRDQLKQILERFQVQSLLALRSTVSEIVSQQKLMNEEASRHHESIRQKLQTIHEEFKQDNHKQTTRKDVDSYEQSYSPIFSDSPSSSLPPSRSTTGDSRNPFAGLVSRSQSVSINNISGNYSVVSNVDNSSRDNFGNTYHINAAGAGRSRSISQGDYGHGHGHGGLRRGRTRSAVVVGSGQNSWGGYAYDSSY
ncbi:hypothetical protein BDP27DRAFT_1421651 [Rhodocollybia butyracea]|uniref:Uncharacterized protein n=1 Tax=Rhodocollybia butyracea TaxID=206335 RepID=A0A9P5U7B1_9AGAR|nr:hypothetical protein BDP27DRAFT_1421651 [Rhodocollybia butyracea]